eukprot:m.4060 g.4060  ORF g.4060 m.4060 type:complete len:66 (+) comp4395_c0_seq2:4029-4226(+)
MVVSPFLRMVLLSFLVWPFSLNRNAYLLSVPNTCTHMHTDMQSHKYPSVHIYFNVSLLAHAQHTI